MAPASIPISNIRQNRTCSLSLNCSPFLHRIRGSAPLYNDRRGGGCPMAVVIKRVYDPPSRGDGTRVLVDRLWPRGLTKASAAIAQWLRDLAPSHELRRWFHGHPDQWQTFRKKYLKELAVPEAETELRELYDLARRKNRL